MRWRSAWLVLCGGLLAFPALAATGRVIKVLPTFLDLQGKHALSPSLYERDSYQAYLRKHPEKRSGMRFDVEWKTHGGTFEPIRLRVELRGVAKGDLPANIVLEVPVKPGGWFNHWTCLKLTGEEYVRIGEITAWRATLWEGNQLLGEQKSFLW
jgi:hypothetical protein